MSTNLDVGVAVDAVFRDTHVRKIKEELSKVEQLFPEYRLSPTQQIYSTVARDCRVDSDWLKDKMMELELETVDELANRKIYCTADRTVDSYSMNFLWINTDVQDEETDQYIFSNDTLDEFRDSMTEWRRINPRAVINLWYDSTLVTDRAYYNTKDLCSELDIEIRYI